MAREKIIHKALKYAVKMDLLPFAPPTRWSAPRSSGTLRTITGRRSWRGCWSKPAGTPELLPKIMYADVTLREKKSPVIWAKALI